MDNLRTKVPYFTFVHASFFIGEVCNFCGGYKKLEKITECFS